MLEIRSIVIPELSQEQRRVYIYLPVAAESDPKRRFPVLYMFDGHNVFFDEHATYGKSWGLGEYLDYTDTPLIVVAVECSHLGNTRLSEYSPFSFSSRQFGFVPGRGKVTMDWLVGTLKPLVDACYPTLSGREDTFIAGSSMGGLMSLYALCAYHEVFSRAAALSPSIVFGGSELDALLKSAPLGRDDVLYMDMGEKELNWSRSVLRRWRTVNDIILKRGVLLTSRLVPGGEHNEASWEKQIPFFLGTLLYDREV